ncbi:hypothetical protein [Streptomyces sp. NRRL S-495]|uniref:hypothetical protein n=1 Tax=Streptomyces sp. NRRL S-495 TaxID=1609133 RepID=UPI0005F94487|nr:hypothetical protein [Streptomyces sp. NRRL S-495]KJY31953.1 hypothetical protein VR45_23625 [Streptomyces sp. NRRL S-495]
MTEDANAAAGPEENRPPAGANWNTGGVQVVGSTVYGPVAGGQGATVRIGADAAPAAPVGPEALRAAAETLRAALARLRAERPGAVADADAEDADAEDADAALAGILAETALDEPREGPLRRRVGTVVDALRTVAVLAAAVTGLEAAFAALFGQI